MQTRTTSGTSKCEFTFRDPLWTCRTAIASRNAADSRKTRFGTFLRDFMDNRLSIAESSYAAWKLELLFSVAQRKLCRIGFASHPAQTIDLILFPCSLSSHSGPSSTQTRSAESKRARLRNGTWRNARRPQRERSTRRSDNRFGRCHVSKKRRLWVEASLSTNLRICAIYSYYVGVRWKVTC